MALLCSGLAVIQYRWTGELSQTEASRLRANLREQLRQISRAFNAELNENCRALTPLIAETEAQGPTEAIAIRYRQWMSREHRPIFSRVGVALRRGSAASLRVVNPVTLRWEPWLESEAETAPKITLPVAGSANEAIVLEIDLPYLRQTWLPELTRTWLSASNDAVRVRIETTAVPRSTIYASSGEIPGSGAPDATAEIFSIRGSLQDEHHWALEAWRIDGPIDAVVSASRWRNFAVAGLLILVILFAGTTLLRYTRRSRRLAEMQLTFIAGVSHELKTPLAVIRGAAHNLAEGVVREERPIRMYGAMIRRHADQLNETVEQVLTFAGTSRIPQSLAQPLSVDELLHDAVEGASADVQASGCTVNIDIETGLPCVSGDRAALCRAFLNLVSNAVRHGGTGGWVGITARKASLRNREAIEVRVEDRGPGIPENEMLRVFEPFFRGERAIAGPIRGFGLGLSLVRDIVTAHSGSVSVRRSATGGAEFSMFLPALTEQME